MDIWSNNGQVLSTLARNLATTRVLAKELAENLDSDVNNQLEQNTNDHDKDIEVPENQSSFNGLLSTVKNAANEIIRSKILVTESMAIMDHDESLLSSEARYKNHLQQQRIALERRLKEYQAKEEAWNRERNELLGQSTNQNIPASDSSIISHRSNQAQLDELRTLRQENFQLQLQIAKTKEAKKGIIESVTQSSLLILKMLWAATSANESILSILPALAISSSNSETRADLAESEFRIFIQDTILSYVEGDIESSHADEIVSACCGIIQNIAATDEGREALIKTKSGDSIVELLHMLLISIGRGAREAKIKSRALAAIGNIALSDAGIALMKEQKSLNILINIMNGEPNEAVREQCVELMLVFLTSTKFSVFENRQQGYDVIRELSADPAATVRQVASKLLEAYVTFCARQDISGEQ